MFLCRTVEYPAVPQDLIDNIQLGKLIREYPGRECQHHGTKFATSPGAYYYVNSEIESWIRDTVNLDIDYVGVRYQYGTADLCSQGAHTDATRDYALLYTIDNAGGYLQFWQQTNSPLELDSLHLITDYDRLTKVNAFNIPNNQWYLVSGRVLHSVENITRTRITLQVNLKSI